MNNSLSQLEQYDKLLPVAKSLYAHTSYLSWQMLLPLFLLSIAIGYSTDLGITGSILVRLKRLFIVALLLVAFPAIAEFVQILGTEIARGIDDMTGIDMVFDAASKKADTWSFDLNGILNMGSDLLLGALALCSFLILMLARYLLLAFQHFYWLLMVVLAPFMILASLFESASGVTKSLFKNMFQIAAWPIIWSILSAFLKTIPFASIYATEGGLLTVVTLNLIIAVALLFSPFIVSQLCDGVSLSVGDTLRKGALKAVAIANPKAAVITNKAERLEKFSQTRKLINK
jgi:hypothetical protein